MSQRSSFTYRLGNIFYESMRLKVIDIFRKEAYSIITKYVFCFSNNYLDLVKHRTCKGSRVAEGKISAVRLFYSRDKTVSLKKRGERICSQ